MMTNTTIFSKQIEDLTKQINDLRDDKGSSAETADSLKKAAEKLEQDIRNASKIHTLKDSNDDHDPKRS